MASTAKTRALVLGGEGMLGRAVVRHWRSRGLAALGVSSRQADIRDPDALRFWVDSFRPEVIVNCAAFTDVDGCEDRDDHALAVNGTAVGNVVEAAESADAVLVQISTDYVFDGRGQEPYREDHELEPLSSYGRSKLRGEQEALAYGQSLVIRTSWLFGPGGKNFAATMLRLMAAGENRPIRVVDDQVGCPTYAPYLARGVHSLLASGGLGVVHYRNRDEVSWYRFACEIARGVGGIRPEVVPVTSAEFPRPAPRPGYSVLAIDRFEELVGRPVEPWASGLTSYIDYLHIRGEEI